MQPIDYEFYLNDTQVYPIFKNLTKKYERESRYVFFREKLEGELKLQGADYFLVKNASIYNENTFTVRTKINGVYEDYIRATFNKTDCEFDTDKRICKLKLSPKDDYSDILNNYSNEYNLIDLAPALTAVNVTKRPILQVYVLEDNIINNFLPNGVTWETDADPGIGLIELYEKGQFALQSRHVEIRIEDGGQYDGIYTGNDWAGATLLSPINPKYKIVGTVTPEGNGYTYYFHIFDADDYLLANMRYTTGTVTASSRYTTLTFRNPNNSNDFFYANASMETVLVRLLSGFSITHDGETALTRLSEGDFGYTEGYAYVYNAITAASTVIRPATSQEPTMYGKADNGYYFTSPPTTSGIYYPFARSTWVYSSRWIYINTARFSSFDLYGSTYNDIKDCIHISDVISVLLKKVAPNITHEKNEEYSRFLYGSSNPIYGEKFELFITQKTHIKKIIYDEPATKVPITLESVMDMLEKCFRCYWYIEDGKLKIEHISFFENGRTYDKDSKEIGIDVTSMYDNRNGKSIGFGQNTIKYDKNSLPSRYEFSYMDKSSIEFESAPVKLTAAYLQADKTESINIDGFSADLDMIIANRISISDDGFALIAAKETESDGIVYYSTFKYDLQLISEQGNQYQVSLQNGVLSWYYLFNYYCTSLPSTLAEYDGFPKKQINVTGVTKCITQEIKIPIEIKPSLYDLVKTDIGNGQITSMSIDIVNRQATIGLVYPLE